MKVVGDLVGFIIRDYNYHISFNVILAVSACTPIVYMVGSKGVFNRATLREKMMPKLLRMFKQNNN